MNSRLFQITVLRNVRPMVKVNELRRRDSLFRPSLPSSSIHGLLYFLPDTGVKRRYKLPKWGLGRSSSRQLSMLKCVTKTGLLQRFR